MTAARENATTTVAASSRAMSTPPTSVSGPVSRSVHTTSSASP